MTTPLAIIKGAMRDIGALQAGEAPTAEEAQDGLESLIDMIAFWELEGMAMGDESLTLSSDIQLPRNHVVGLRKNLAVYLCPEYGLTPSPNLQMQADQGYRALQGAYGEPVDMTVDPAIWRRWYWPSGYSY